MGIIIKISRKKKKKKKKKKNKLSWNIYRSMRRRGMRKFGGRVSRIGCYAIASSIISDPTSFSCTTFNILAPIYKRVNQEVDENCRESDNRDYWLKRNRRILDLLLYERSSIICLQEFWVANEELVDLYKNRLGDAGYINFMLARTNNRGDGLLTAVHKDYFRVIRHRDVIFNGFGDRVAQLLHVEVVSPYWEYSKYNNVPQEILIINTHILFPHDSSLCLERLRQVYKILQYVESYQKENNLNPMPVILCGDWNGSKRGHVYEFLRSQGFVSSYDTAHLYTDADAHKWVSHLNHRGNICGVDFIWLLNPNRYQKLLKTSWSEAMFGMFKHHLRRASLTADDAFSFFKAESDANYITYSGFCEGLRQLKLIGHRNGLSDDETKELWLQTDVDGNGSLDYNKFQQELWYSSCLLDEMEKDVNIITSSEDIRRLMYRTEQSIGFSVKNAVLFPTQVEKGMWPDDYVLSDHARLTVVFSPVRMLCSRSIP